jgi:hypothetical protein
MGMMKNYRLGLLQQCSEEKFGQDAIEWAIVSGFVKLSYDLDHDIHQTMSRYDDIIDAYRVALAQETHRSPNQPAPMQRAAPRRRSTARTAPPAAKKKHAA